MEMGGKYRAPRIFWGYYWAHEHDGAAIGRDGDGLLLLDDLFQSHQMKLEDEDFQAR